MKKFILIAGSIVAITILLFSAFLIGQKPPQKIQVSYNLLIPDVQQQIDCLAENIYHEARSEPKEGQVAVAFVTLNRVNSHHFPNDICSVVTQKTKGTCQFSWFCQDKEKSTFTNKTLTKTNNVLYNKIRKLAIQVYANYEVMNDPSQGALFYHADYVSPNWRNVEETTIIGRHIFYSLKENV